MENTNVEIKCFFKWESVPKDVAYNFCEGFMKGIQTTSIREERIAIINRYHLRGITFEELEKEVNGQCNA